MPTDGGLSIAAVLSALNFGYRSLQTGYELQAVPEQAQNLLATIETSSRDIEFARSLRRRKSGILSGQEKAHIDEKITDTEAALRGLEALVEAARVDMMTRFGRIRPWNRALWVVRESPQVGTSLARLNVALPALNTVVAVMSLREGDKSVDEDYPNTRGNAVPTGPPPTYQTSEFMHQRRMRRNRRSGDDTTETAGLEALGSDQSTERASQVPPYPAHSNPFAGIHELEGSQAYPPPLPRQSTSRDIPACLRAGPTALQLFGPVEDTRRRRSRIAWSHIESDDGGLDRDYPRTSPFGEPRETEQAGRSHRTRLAWAEGIDGYAESPAEQSQSWRAYQASLPA
jgi:hypothetical protein